MPVANPDEQLLVPCHLGCRQAIIILPPCICPPSANLMDATACDARSYNHVYIYVYVHRQ